MTSYKEHREDVAREVVSIVISNKPPASPRYLSRRHFHVANIWREAADSRLTYLHVALILDLAGTGHSSLHLDVASTRYQEYSMAGGRALIPYSITIY
jgi:hypothetical protein